MLFVYFVSIFLSYLASIEEETPSGTEGVLVILK